MSVEATDTAGASVPTSRSDRHLGRFRVEKTSDWRWDKEFNVQINPVDLDRMPDISVGDYVLVQNPHSRIAPAVFGRIDEGDHLAEGQVGIGFDLRHALGVPRDDPERNSVALLNVAPDAKGYHHRAFERVLQYRPILCRVRYATHPDIGFETCRIPEESFDVLGIEPGDRVFLQSPHGRSSLKALPERETTRQRKAAQREQNPGRYLDCQGLLGIEGIAGTEVDLPRIYLDAEQRERSGLADTANGGLCQPVVVYRDSQAFFLRKLNDVAVPVVGALLGFIVVLRGVLALGYLLAILAVAVLVIVLSLLYEVRFESLD